MINNLKIGVRLAAGFLMILALMAIVAAVSLLRMNDMQTKLRESDTFNLVSLGAAADMRASTLNMLLAARRFEIPTEQRAAQIRDSEGKFDAALQRFQDAALVQTERDDVTDARALTTALRPSLEEFAAYDLKDPRRYGAAVKVEHLALPIIAKMNDIVALEKKTMNADYEDSVALYNSARSMVIILVILATLVGIVLAIVITRSVVVPLTRALEAANAIAGNDLTQDIAYSGHDETAELLQAMDGMKSNLVKLISQIRQSVENVNSAAREIASGNANLSQRTEEQASSLEETASSMEELTSTVKQNTDNARQANDLAIKASETAAQGGKAVDEVVRTMASINESARKIAEIIAVIDGIAFQTNILALNAAVEAARAGEQGRGFAVVAGEVRNLAQRSAEAAKEIKSLIGSSVEKVNGGSKLVDDAGRTMTDVVMAVKRVTDIMGEIAAASREQLSGIEQVNVAVTQMDQVTQQNAALVEEAAAAAASLEDQAHNLVGAVAVFRTGADVAAVLPTARTKSEHTNGHSVGAAPRLQTPHANGHGPRRPLAAAPAVRDNGDDEEWETF